MAIRFAANRGPRFKPSKLGTFSGMLGILGTIFRFGNLSGQKKNGLPQNGGVTNRGFRGVWPPALEIGPFPAFLSEVSNRGWREGVGD